MYFFSFHFSSIVAGRCHAAHTIEVADVTMETQFEAPIPEQLLDYALSSTLYILV